MAVTSADVDRDTPRFARRAETRSSLRTLESVASLRESSSLSSASGRVSWPYMSRTSPDASDSSSNKLSPPVSLLRMLTSGSKAESSSESVPAKRLDNIVRPRVPVDIARSGPGW